MKTATLVFGLLAVAPSLGAQDRPRSTDYDRPTSDVRRSCGSCSRGRCSEGEWREIRRCEDRSRDIERKEAEWRAEARKRRIDFENEMAHREREFKQREQERWDKHQREIARRWGDARR